MSGSTGSNGSSGQAGQMGRVEQVGQVGQNLFFYLLNTTLQFWSRSFIKADFFWNDNYNPSFWSRSFSQCGTFSIQLFFAITLFFWFSHLFINGKVSIGWWFPKHWKLSTVKLEVAFLVLGVCSSSPTEGWEPSEVELDHRTWPCLLCEKTCFHSVQGFTKNPAFQLAENSKSKSSTIPNFHEPMTDTTMAPHLKWWKPRSQSNFFDDLAPTWGESTGAQISMGFDQNLRLHGTVLAGVMQVANLGVDMSRYWIYQISPIEGSQGCLNKGGGGGYIYI